MRTHVYFIIFIFIAILGMFVYRWIWICVNYFRTNHNEDTNDQPIAINICINPLDEESPPSYEQVMNADSQYRFGNPR